MNEDSSKPTELDDLSSTSCSPPRQRAPPPPVPKPRTKFHFNSPDSCRASPHFESSTDSSPRVPPSRPPPPRPPPPRRSLDGCVPLPKLYPSLNGSSDGGHPAQNQDHTPTTPPHPIIPPRPQRPHLFDGQSVPVTPVDCAGPNCPSTTDFWEATPSSPKNSADTVEITDVSVPSSDPENVSASAIQLPPPVGWLLPKLPSLEESMEPLPNLPSGSILEPVGVDVVEVALDPEGDLVPDRPTLLTDRPHWSHQSLSLDHTLTPGSSRSVSPELEEQPIFMDCQQQQQNPWIDYVENPIYLNLSHFQSRLMPSGTTLASMSSLAPVPVLEPALITSNMAYLPATIPLPRQQPVRVSEPVVPEPPRRTCYLPPPVAPVRRPSPPCLSRQVQIAPKSTEAPRELNYSPTFDVVDVPGLNPPIVDLPPESEVEELTPTVPVPFREFSRSPVIGMSKTFAGDSFNTDSYFFAVDVVDPSEDVIEVVHPSVQNEDVSVADGHSVSYSGYATLHNQKKEKGVVHIRLRQLHIAVYENEESEEPILGPYDLPKAEFVGLQPESQAIVCRFAIVERKESSSFSKKLKVDKSRTETSVQELKFTPQEQTDTWLFMLAECWLSSWEGLRGCISSGMTCCGRLWLRQGSTASWTYAAGFLHGNTIYYVVMDHADSIFELELRKIVSIKSKLDPSDWCPHTRKKEKGKDKGSGGPFLITQHGCSLCVECDDPTCSVLWLRSIELALAKPALYLDDFRLTAEDVPVCIDKCIRYVATYGLYTEGIYRRNGKVTEAKEIMKQLMSDPVEYHIVKETEETSFAVADVLRQILRRLHSPLMPTDCHNELFNIHKMNQPFPMKCAAYRQLFSTPQFPPIYYSTVRRLIGHLREVAQHSEVNRASVDNVAKIFGPSVFCTENGKDDNQYRDTSVQIGVVVDLINGFADVFEMTMKEAVTRAKIDMATTFNAQTKVRADGLLVPIHMWEKENRPFNVKTDLCSDQVCLEAIKLRGFDAPADSKYAIFEFVRSGSLSRRLLPSEKLSSVVIGRWLDWQCTDGYLLFDHDTQPYDDKEISTFSGKVKLAEPGSKTFKSGELQVKDGTKLCLFRGTKLQEEWDIDYTIWYNGAEQGRKAPQPFNATFFHSSSVQYNDKFCGWCLSFKTLLERSKFLNAVHFAQTRGAPPVMLHF